LFDYETLEESSARWHAGRHDPWPCINFVLFVLRAAYAEFAERVGEMKAVRGEKRRLVIAAIERQRGSFGVADIRNACPGVSVDLIRKTLGALRDAGNVECLGLGRNARWRRR